MYVKINRDLCSHQLSICERCLGQFLKYPMGYERPCFELLKDDGREDLTLVLHTNGHTVMFKLDEEEREMIAGEGWARYVDFAVPMYRNHPEAG